MNITGAEPPARVLDVGVQGDPVADLQLVVLGHPLLDDDLVVLAVRADAGARYELGLAAPEFVDLVQVAYTVRGEEVHVGGFLPAGAGTGWCRFTWSVGAATASFYQAQERGAGRRRGHGLGPAIVRSVTTAHHGPPRPTTARWTLRRIRRAV